MPLNFALAGKQYPDHKETMTADAIAAYAAASGDDNPQHLPGPDQVASPIFPVVHGLPLMMLATGDPELGVDNPLTILHGEHEIIHHRPVRPGDELVFSTTLEAVEDKGKNATFTVRIAARDLAGEPVHDQSGVMFVRGGGSGAQREKSASPAPPERGEVAASFTRHVASDMTVGYAEASGDHNPIHLDDEMAKMVGLPGIINHGLGTLSLVTGGLVENAAGGDAARLRRIAVRFTDIVLPGSDLATTVWDAGDALGFETARPDGVVVLVGEIEVA